MIRENSNELIFLTKKNCKVLLFSIVKLKYLFKNFLLCISMVKKSMNHLDRIQMNVWDANSK